MVLRASDLPPEVRKRLGLTEQTRQKFNAVAVVADGYRFDSLKEERRYFELGCLEKAGEIENLHVHPRFNLTHDGVVFAVMTLDFAYVRRRSRVWVYEDVKGGRATRTQVYALRKKLLEQQHGIDISEV